MNLFNGITNSIKHMPQGFSKKVATVCVSALLMSQAFAHGNEQMNGRYHETASSSVDTQWITDQILLKLKRLDRLANNHLRSQKQRKVNQLTGDIRDLLDQLQQDSLLSAKQFQKLTQTFRYTHPNERVSNFKRAVQHKRFHSNQLVELLKINQDLKRYNDPKRTICLQQQDLILSSVDKLVDTQNNGWWKDRLVMHIACKNIKKQTRKTLNKRLR